MARCRELRELGWWCQCAGVTRIDQTVKAGRSTTGHVSTSSACCWKWLAGAEIAWLNRAAESASSVACSNSAHCATGALFLFGEKLCSFDNSPAGSRNKFTYMLSPHDLSRAPLVPKSNHGRAARKPATDQAAARPEGSSTFSSLPSLLGKGDVEIAATT